MSFNCLTCQVLRRTGSNNDRDYCGKEKDHSMNNYCVNRTWSGNISRATNYEQSRSDQSMSVVASKKINKRHRRLNTIDTTYGAKGCKADAEPRLVRSCGMRRDWSFEDLRDEKMRKEMRVRSDYACMAGPKNLI